jgi:hypothetical protein
MTIVSELISLLEEPDLTTIAPVSVPFSSNFLHLKALLLGRQHHIQ